MTESEQRVLVTVKDAIYLMRNLGGDPRLADVSLVVVAADVSALSHGPGMIFDFENSIRRSPTETTRYEFKQGLLRLDNNRQIDPMIISTIMETICGIVNVGPDADGFLYIGIADKPAYAFRRSSRSLRNQRERPLSS
jgi:hypothetical protein